MTGNFPAFNLKETIMRKTTEIVKSDVKDVLDHAEDLLKQAAATTGEQAAELHRRGMTLLRQASDKAQELQEVVVEKSKAAAQATDDYVHDHPWKSIGMAAVAGFAIGLLVNRSR